ncbi:MAG TPA: N,N-dimethylformamidase beta subunit family domain-containing protein [Vicinamibacterales bacterium]|nr:N,N-dimethylformamidase beta subunit family domain-containing protein [Vicinamibacterales bacterium]
MNRPFCALTSRFTVRAFIVIVTALILMLFDRGASHPIVHASPTTIADENAKPGASNWDISGAGDPDIQGFATDISVNVGETVHFKIAAPGAIAGYTIDVYRLGYYGDKGATLVTTLTVAPPAQTQPACMADATTGLVDCGNWTESASWAVPSTAVSGIYVAKLTRSDNGNSSHIIFVVRDDARTADIVFQTSDTTWQAYNQYPGVTNGGASLYCGGPLSNGGSSYSCQTRAAKVSYNRPFDTRAHDPQSFLFNAEYPLIRWLEANGYDVKYQSGVDTDRRGADLVGAHKPNVFLSVGHDEYWSGAQRQAVEAARTAGVNLAFFSGNEMYWKTRYEPSIDGSNAAYRTLVSYKETIANAKIDPAVDPQTGKGVWTGTWRDPRFAATSDGGQPENGLTGQLFTVNCCADRIKIPQAMGSLRLWAHTGVSAVAAGDVYRTPEETLGYEWDEDVDNGSRPAGLIRLSSTTLDEPEKLSDFGANVAPGRATHTLTLYRHSSGALVFGAGTVQWSWGLDGNHDRGTAPTSHTTDQAMEQATVNLLADMGAQPATLQVGPDPSNPRLFTAIKSTDAAAPVSAVVFPTNGGTVSAGVPVTITGTSTDQGGGLVAGVEVSVDGGATWKAAQGTTLWNVDWTPGVPGSASIKVRAIDDSGNREVAGAGSAVSIVPGVCPCTSIWQPTAAPGVASAADANAVELGVQFTSDIDGFITGIRFYKGATNTGTHSGSLWSSTGARLATADFSSETPSGWQQVLFSTPVAITANTVYVASYHTDVGNYAASGGYFATVGVDSPPLHAPQSTAQRPNGLFSYGASAFPQNTFNATNYWVDVVFAPGVLDTTPPQISAITASALDSSRAMLTWITDELATSRIDVGTDPAILVASIDNLPPGTTTVSSANFVAQHTTSLTGLQPKTTYYSLITAIDRSGNRATIAAPPFSMPGPTLRDTAASDFAAGSIGTATYVSQTDDGELILAPSVGSEFTGPALSPGWTQAPWAAGGGYSIIGGGVLRVDGARVASCSVDPNGACLPETFDATPSAIFSAPHRIEFTANFSGDAFQHAGLGVTFATPTEPWAIFSTLSGGMLFARTNNGAGSTLDTSLGSGLVGSFHRFAIDWKADHVDYYVDGAIVASHVLAVAGPMRPVAASDLTAAGGTIFVDWMRMSPYPATGTFDSRIFDAAATVAWNTIRWKTTTPDGTSVAISVRGGDTATPDGTWSAYAPMSSGGPVSLTSRYVQYRAVLATGNPDVTPQLEDITISTDNAPVANPDSAVVAVNGSHTFAASGPGSLTANDSDADASDVLHVAGVTAASHGTVVLNGDGSVTYTPAANYSGPDGFTYTVSDGLLTASAPVSIDVHFGNVPPVAVNDAYSVNEDATLTIPATAGVLSNDTDADHDSLTATLTAPPVNGTLTLGADGGFTYQPNPDFFGSDSFTYTVSDGHGGTATGTVNVTVTPVNDVPIFTKGADQINAGVVGAQTVTNWATKISAGPANESGQALNFIVSNNNTALFSAQPAVAPDGTLTYTPTANATGSATVIVSLHDNGGIANGGVDTSAPQTFTITVNKATTTTALSSSLNPTVYGQAVTFTATVAVVAPGSGTASGTVTFMDGAAALGTATLDAGAKATFTTSGVRAGARSITAVYAGAAVFGGSTSAALTQNVGTVKLTITADSKTRPVGSDNPPMTVSYSGFVNGDTAANLATPPNVTTTATTASPAGAYPITASGAASNDYTFTYLSGTMKVIPVPTLTAADSSVAEGNSTAPFAIVVTLSSAMDVPATVDYATANATAVAGVDYVSTSGTLVFASGERTKAVAVPIIGNQLFQNDRTFTLKLSNAKNATIPSASVKVTIVDDDPKPVISISANSVVEGNSGTTPVTVTLTLTGATALPASATYATADGTATAGSDYLAASGTVTFAPGETVKTFVVSVLGDIVPEATETFTVRITSTASAATGVKVATVSIIDDDSTSWVDATAADFAAGTVDGTYISQTDNGEVILAPALGSEFSGQILDGGWTSKALVAGGAATLGAGGITIDGASVVGGASGFTAGRSVEFSAKFSGAAGQNAGFTATGALSAPYAVFGTKAAGTLLARSVIAGTTLETPISGYKFNQIHKFRIDWNATTVVYWVDDTKVATHTITLSQPMFPTAFDVTVGDGALFIHYMRMTPYAAAGTYTSAVFDAGSVVTWMTMSWTATLPAGTTVALKYRTGNTPTPDATWSTLKAVSASGAALSGSTRYLQFVVQESTSDLSQTAVLKDVTLAFKR